MVKAFADLSVRWRHARRAALRAGLPDTDTNPAPSDDVLLSRALATDAAAANRRAFDNSLRLGGGFASFFGKVFGVEELPAVLAQLDAPCLTGTWREAEGEPAVILERHGCPDGRCNRATCDFWREAIDGLVLGITDGIRHTRHRSMGHGDDSCVDVVYDRPESALRFGAIPDDVRTVLERVRAMARLFDSATSVDFLGISEGTLFYQTKSTGCAGTISVTSLLERELQRRLPQFTAKEVSPRSVLANDGETQD